MQATRMIVAVALIASAHLWGASLVVTNGGFEECTGTMGNEAVFWVGNNA